jgi:hypothetical protein
METLNTMLSNMDVPTVFCTMLLFLFMNIVMQIKSYIDMRVTLLHLEMQDKYLNRKLREVLFGKNHG